MASYLSGVTLAPVPAMRNRARALLALSGTTPLTHVLLDSPRVDAALNDIVRARRPDVVLAYCSGMAKYLFHPALRDIPAVLDMVDVDSRKWADLERTTSAPKSWIFRRESRRLDTFERRAVARAYATLAVNERERDTLAAMAPGARLMVVPNGIDVPYFRPSGAPSEQPIVVFCGVMNYAPNAQAATWFAENVWPLVRVAHPTATFKIVGSDPTAEVRRLAKPGANIQVTGSVPDVRPFLWEAAVSVAPLWVSRGLQNKVLEAQAAQLPCVITPPVADGLPVAARTACRIAESAETFAAQVNELLNLNGMARRCLVAGAQIEMSDWAKQLSGVIDILEEAADRG
jgi:polysaccharide biosynthesis protein PslH